MGEGEVSFQVETNAKDALKHEVGHSQILEWGVIIGHAASKEMFSFRFDSNIIPAEEMSVKISFSYGVHLLE